MAPLTLIVSLLLNSVWESLGDPFHRCWQWELGVRGSVGGSFHLHCPWWLSGKTCRARRLFVTCAWLDLPVAVLSSHQCWVGILSHKHWVWVLSHKLQVWVWVINYSFRVVHQVNETESNRSATWTLNLFFFWHMVYFWWLSLITFQLLFYKNMWLELWVNKLKSESSWSSLSNFLIGFKSES